MGRNAKLRQQRRSGLSEKSVRIFNSRPDMDTAPVSTASQSLLGRLLDRFKPSPKSTNTLPPPAEAFDFFDHHALLLSALAWEGYTKEGRGILFVTDSPSSFEVEYVVRGRLKPKLRSLQVDAEATEAIAEAVKKYYPERDLLMLFVTQTGAIDFVSMPNLDPPPPACYQQRQAELGSPT
ncbi:MAG: hypothetical protein NZ772_17670, partial [Cyanobacteria bacterium]|nr:hypothetical protein [Cyanobacteriota bacterium]MDW8203101.1 hypothetical protein [Cyanobacteriota bacterium SKYGB_h_bin112]